MEEDEYIIINKTSLQKKREELLGWDGIYTGLRRPVYLSDYQKGQIDLIDTISSQSTPLIPEIEKAFDEGAVKYCGSSANIVTFIASSKEKQDYISNLKLNI